MEVNELFSKLKEFGHVNSKRDELREFCATKIDQILKHLHRRILNSDGGDMLDCLLIGLPDNANTSCRNKAKIIDIVLQTMRKESTSLIHCSDVISRLCLELPRMPANDLVRWCNDSVQTIVEDADVNMIWKDVLPECLSALSSYNSIKHCGTEMSPSEYKEQCVHTLCQCRWKEKQLAQLTAMFKDMQLARDDHRQVVNKLCSYIVDISPEMLPPLVHQLLRLCKMFHTEIVLAHLSHYFSVRLYSKLDPPPQDSESTTMDIDDVVPHSPAELSRCLSTCIYHITQGAADPEVIKKHLKLWPKTQLLRAPFLIDVALAVSDKGIDFRTVCLDIIKSAIELRVLDEHRSKESSWVKSVLPPDVDVVSVLKVLTTESANHRQLTVMGLINLAFSLLSVSRVKPVAPSCWSHGKLILVRLCKAQPETAAHILSQLSDRLAGDSTQRQYSDCLHVLCKLTPVSLERCTQLGTILENCAPSPTEYKSAAAVLDAVHPLINFSTRTRDTLVLVCRKGLHSRDSLHRSLALSGLLSIIRHVKLARGAVSSSQSVCSDQHSAYSYLTQITVDLHATNQGAVVTSRVRNETMCLEVVSILRRCLLQDAAVKQLLYTKIYYCVKEKLSLHESILELLYDNLCKYLPENDTNNSTRLLFDKCVQMTGAGATLTEPIAHLLYVIAEFLQPVEEEDLEDILGSQDVETGSAYLKSKLTLVMNKLCASDNLGTVDMDDPGLSDLTPESKAKSLKVQQILQCYEALIAYKIMQWSKNNSLASSVHSLFKAYNQLMEQTKAPAKGKKGNKSLNETRETAKTQKSQKSQKEKGKAPVKVSNLVKDRAGPFKPLPCLWSVQFCHKVVELLYSENVSWSSVEQRNSIRARRDFHHFALRNVLSVLAEQLEKRAVATHVVNIAAVIYKRCVCRFQDMCDFDDTTALICVEVFKVCFSLFLSPNYSFRMESFLPTITGLSETTAPACLATILEQIHSALMYLETEGSEEEHDLLQKKQVSMLVQTASLLLEAPMQQSTEMSAIVIKFENYVRTSKQESLGLIPAVLIAGCRELQETQFIDDLLLKLSAALGRIDEEDTSAGGEDSTNFPTIDSRTGHVALNHICAHLGNRYKCVEHLLYRARDLTSALNSAAHGHQQRIDRELKELYKSIVIELCQLTTWCMRAAKLRCCVGSGSDRVVGACMKLYALLAALAKQISPDMAQLVRLERLLKLSGKKLSTVMDNLITYLEASQQQPTASKVLRDTKLIPRLVLEAEQFSKHIILLANKGKLNYQQYLSLGTARDFRIKASVLQEALNARDQGQDVPENEEEVNINDAATEILEPRSSGDQADNGDDHDERNKRKRRRVS